MLVIGWHTNMVVVVGRCRIVLLSFFYTGFLLRVLHMYTVYYATKLLYPLPPGGCSTQHVKKLIISFHVSVFIQTVSQSVSQMKCRRWRCGSLWTSCDLGSGRQNRLFSPNRRWTSARPVSASAAWPSLRFSFNLPFVSSRDALAAAGRSLGWCSTSAASVLLILSVSTRGPLTFSAWSRAPRRRWRHPGTPEGRRRGYEECKRSLAGWSNYLQT